jgi:hypothetical protein
MLKMGRIQAVTVLLYVSALFGTHVHAGDQAEDWSKSLPRPAFSAQMNSSSVSLPSSQSFDLFERGVTCPAGYGYCDSRFLAFAVRPCSPLTHSQIWATVALRKTDAAKLVAVNDLVRPAVGLVSARVGGIAVVRLAAPRVMDTVAEMAVSALLAISASCGRARSSVVQI